MEGFDPMNTATDSDVLALLNLGPISCEWLHAIGIHTRGDLEATGAVEAYALIRECGFLPSMHLLYALEGALRGVRWNRLSLPARGWSAATSCTAVEPVPITPMRLPSSATL